MQLNDDTVIKVEGLYKKFCKHLRRSMYYGAIDVFRNMLGFPGDTGNLRNHEFWALEDVSFELKRGESLGVIGVNGSGKSTLLRLITGIFPPDRGRIITKGRIGSLIAIGSGIHPHMTGRENIFLNGTILGMSKKEIQSKFDSIVEFGDISDFLEAPVSTYSSGMKVRLGFSIAIHCEPDILLVDEVLSVGDIRFQKKCTDKMQELKNKTSLVFVSHSIRHIYRICDRAILLDSGRMNICGQVGQVVTEYINRNIIKLTKEDDLLILHCYNGINNIKVNIFNNLDESCNEIIFGQKVNIRISFESTENTENMHCSLSVLSPEGAFVTSINTEDFYFNIHKGKNIIDCTINEILAIPGVYYFKVKLSLKHGGLLFEVDTQHFSILEGPGVYKTNLGAYREKGFWKLIQ